MLIMMPSETINARSEMMVSTRTKIRTTHPVQFAGGSSNCSCCGCGGGCSLVSESLDPEKKLPKPMFGGVKGG
ncbi:hypothetical protein KEM55_004621 [Ascosphaera atra]|nr:hypothetical protein KEM55_004621 [Ascosphaera atra]